MKVTITLNKKSSAAMKAICLTRGMQADHFGSALVNCVFETQQRRAAASRWAGMTPEEKAAEMSSVRKKGIKKRGKKKRPARQANSKGLHSDWEYGGLGDAKGELRKLKRQAKAIRKGRKERK